MKEIAQYKEEVLARIANEQGRIREKRRSRLTLVYPFALAFAFLILLFPGMPGSPRTVSRPVDSGYTYHEAGTSVHEVAEYKSLDDPSLPASDEASFGEFVALVISEEKQRYEETKAQKILIDEDCIVLPTVYTHNAVAKQDYVHLGESNTPEFFMYGLNEIWLDK